MNFFSTYWVPCAEVSRGKWKCHIKAGATEISVPDEFLQIKYLTKKSPAIILVQLIVHP